MAFLLSVTWAFHVILTESMSSSLTLRLSSVLSHFSAPFKPESFAPLFPLKRTVAILTEAKTSPLPVSSREQPGEK